MNRMDEIFWSSSIFTREAMAVNHVSPHKFGDRKALGIFRIVATCFMFILFSFLTVYEWLIQGNRVVFVMAWWVSLGTFIFFALSLIPYKAYFSEKRPVISDGNHPFYLWKLLTFINGICLQGGLHLAVLLAHRDESSPKIEILIYAGPFALLAVDWFSNRLYLPASVLLWYPLISYAVFIVYKEIMLVE